MTHGRNAKTSVNPRTKKSSSLLTGYSEEQKKLEDRVARLEARIEQMQQELDRASGMGPAHFYQGAGQKRPGPDKRIDDTELLLHRDNLVQWLEKHWPMIVKPLLAARNPRHVAAVLKPIAAIPDIRPPWQRAIVAHPAKLLEFLRSDKFRIKPPKKTILDALDVYSEKRQRAANRLPTRQIANAMAGVPKLKWRSSFDKCSRNPPSLRVGHETVRHYRTVLGIPEQQA